MKKEILKDYAKGIASSKRANKEFAERLFKKSFSALTVTKVKMSIDDDGLGMRDKADIKAWKRIAEYFAKARNDKAIKGIPEAVEYLNFLSEITLADKSSFTVGGVMELFIEATLSSAAQQVASQKNSDVRAWALERWNERPDRKISKTKFAEQLALEASNVFSDKGTRGKFQISADRIARNYLPKTSK